MGKAVETPARPRRTFYDAEYVHLLHEKTIDETDNVVAARIQASLKAHFESNTADPRASGPACIYSAEGCTPTVST